MKQACRVLLFLLIAFCSQSAVAECKGLMWGVHVCETQSEAHDYALLKAKGHGVAGYHHWVEYEDINEWVYLGKKYYGKYLCKQRNDKGELIGCADGTQTVWTTLPEGCTVDGGVVSCARDEEPGHSQGCSPECPVGNPIDAGSGNKNQREIDFVISDLLRFERIFNSASVAPYSGVGLYWTHTYSARVEKTSDVNAYVHRADGQRLRFTRTSSTQPWQASTDVSVRLDEQVDGSGATVQWTFTPVDAREVEQFDALGRLSSIIRSDGSSVALIFNNSVVEGNRNDYLVTSVTDNRGRSLSFSYNAAKRLVGVIGPDSQTYGYSYDGRGRLATATRPDSTSRTYHYNEAAFTGGRNIIPALTGITDENGARFATFEYGELSRAIATSHAGNVDRFEVAFGSAGTSEVTTPSGSVRSITFTNAFSKLKPVAISTTCSGCAPRTMTLTYDANGHRDVVTNAEGVTTDYDYNARGLMDQRIDAANDAGGSRRRTEFDWHAIFSLPTERRVYDAADALVAKSSWAYNTRGQVLASSTVDPSTLVARTVAYSYCEAADASLPNSSCPFVGLLRSVDGPMPGVSDSITYEYHADTDLAGCGTNAGHCHRRGDPWRITDGLGRQTLLERYDLAGRVTQVRDQNAVVTRFEYDPRGRTTTRKVLGPEDDANADGAATRLEYDDVGQVTRLILPDGSYITFSYDNAHRLIGVEDALGNSLTYSLDAAGNRFEEKARDSSGVLRHTLARVFNQLGEMDMAADAFANPTDFTYDEAGRINTVTDAFGRTTDNDHDALGRLRRSIANVGGTGAERAETQFEYDALDNLTAVIDPKGLITNYIYNGLGDLVELGSPDTGTATYAYDSAGNRISQLDARGIESFYQYDALNRLTGINLPTPGEDIGFVYDTAPAECPAGETFAIGRLSQFIDASGHTRYCHDHRGNVARKIQTITGGPTRTVAYTYNAADRVMAITYPSGLVLTYTRNAAGQITGVTAKNSPAEAPVALVTQASYLPFGPLSGLTFGNGRELQKSYDLNYGIAGVTDNASNGLALGYTLDDVGNVVGLSERQTGGATATRSVDYDGLDRLTALKDGATLVQGFSYDATGNRTSKSAPATSNYLYAADSHRLTKVGTQNRAYDAAGNTTSIHSRHYTYDDRGRMRQSRNGTTVLRDYRYNALGQRVAKLHPTTSTSSAFFVYDEAGRLLGEYKPDGTMIKEYLWLDDTLVAVRGGYAGHKFQYVLTDHLNTPRAIVLPATNTIIWRWDLAQTAFGDHAAQNNPDGDASNYVFNLRYPGQYFDSETGLHYNYFRDYDPSTGRYVQSDPIGLAGGTSTYGYALGNSLGATDPLGLWAMAAPWTYSPPSALWAAARATGGVGAAAAGGALVGHGFNSAYEWSRNGRSPGTDLHDLISGDIPFGALGCESPGNVGCGAFSEDYNNPARVAEKARLDALKASRPPGNDDECRKIVWLITRNHAYITGLRLFDARYGLNGRHEGAIAEREANSANLRNQYRRKCGGECPI